MNKEEWEKILGRKFDEPEIIDGKKRYKPGTGIDLEFKAKPIKPIKEGE